MQGLHLLDSRSIPYTSPRSQCVLKLYPFSYSRHNKDKCKVDTDGIARRPQFEVDSGAGSMDKVTRRNHLKQNQHILTGSRDESFLDFTSLFSQGLPRHRLPKARRPCHGRWPDYLQGAQFNLKGRHRPPILQITDPPYPPNTNHIYSNIPHPFDPIPRHD